MDDVIENCHNTFEEDGVSQQTLEDLKTVSGPALASQSFGFILIFLFPPKIFPSSKTQPFSSYDANDLDTACGDFNLVFCVSLLWQGPWILGSPGGRFEKWEFGRFWGELLGI